MKFLTSLLILLCFSVNTLAAAVPPLDPVGREFAAPLLAKELGSTPATPAAGKRKLYPKSDGFYQLDSTGTESKVGSGSGGGLQNYVTNPSADTSTTGYARYKDTAGVEPVDGVAGSPTSCLTFTRNTTLPIRPSADFLLSKTAANCQGEGVGYEITLDIADKYKNLELNFEDYFASGSYADNDVQVFLYDIDNIKMIYANNNSQNVLKHGLASYQHRAIFQLTDSTHYRIIWHVASTSASAWSIQMRGIRFGAQNPVASGAPVSDWTPYSLVIGATTTAPTLGTISVNSAKWRRVGDSMEIQYQLATSALGSAASGSGTYLFPIPTGYTIDSSKVTASSNIASNSVGAASVYTVDATKAAAGVVTAYSSTQLAIVAGMDTTAPTFISNGYYAFGSAQVQVSFTALIPITGWSSNMVFASETGAPVELVATLASGVSAAASANFAGFTVVKDSAGAFNATTGNYTVKDGRSLFVSFRYQVNAANTNVAWITVNGADVARGSQTTTSLDKEVSTLLTGLKAGDVIAFPNISGSTITLGGTSATNRLSIMSITDTQTIAFNNGVVTPYSGFWQRISARVGGATDLTECTGTCTLYKSSGGFLNAVRTGAGGYTITYDTTKFNGVPHCGAQAISQTSSGKHAFMYSHSAGTFYVSTTTFAGSNSDEILEIWCDGPR